MSNMIWDGKSLFIPPGAPRLLVIKSCGETVDSPCSHVSLTLDDGVSHTLRPGKEVEVSDKTVTFEGKAVEFAYIVGCWVRVPDDTPLGRYTVTLTPVEPELRNCPFCGSEAFRETGTHRVTCRTIACPMHYVWVTPAAWNRRGT